MPAQYSYLVADLRTNQILGEVPLIGVSYTKKLNGSGTFSGTLPLSPKFSGDARDLTSPAIRAVYVMRGDTPVYGGIIWTRSYDSATRKVQIQGADWWSYFNARFILPVLSGAAYTDSTYVAGLSTSYSGVEQNQLMRNLIALAQSHTGGDIGIDVASDISTSFIPRDRIYYGYKLTRVGDALIEICNDINGPDVAFDVAATNSSGQPRRVLRLGTPRLGIQGSALRFDLGGNLLSFQWKSDASKMDTRTFATTDGTAEGTPIAAYQDTSLYGNSWPLQESATNYSNISNMSTLFAHAQSDQQVARLPVALPVLRVDSELHPTVDEINVGDDALVTIPSGADPFAAGMDPFYSNGLSTVMRLVQVDVKPRDTGGEDTTLTMAPTLSDVY
jgi:hypothetical protein